MRMVRRCVAGTRKTYAHISIASVRGDAKLGARKVDSHCHGAERFEDAEETICLEE